MIIMKNYRTGERVSAVMLVDGKCVLRQVCEDEPSVKEFLIEFLSG